MQQIRLAWVLFRADCYSQVKYLYHALRDFLWWAKEGLIVRMAYPAGTVLLYRPNGWFVSDPVRWVYDGVEAQLREQGVSLAIRDQRRCGSCSVFLRLATNVARLCAYHTVASPALARRAQFWKVGFERGEYHLYRDAYSSAGAFARSLGAAARIGVRREPCKAIEKKYWFEREAGGTSVRLPAEYEFVALQVPGDSVLGFAGFGAWTSPIRRALKQRAGRALVVKHHPMDGAKTTLAVWRALEALVPDLQFMQEMDSIALIDGAARVYVCNSGVGFETLCRGVPLQVCARFADYPSCEAAAVDERADYLARYSAEYSADVDRARAALLRFLLNEQ